MKFMKRFTWLAAAAVAIGLVTGPALAQDEEGLKVGDEAPDFELMGSDGNTYTLSQFKGEKSVAIAFFPKAFTPG